MSGLFVNVVADTDSETVDVVIWTVKEHGPERVCVLAMKPDQAESLAGSIGTAAAVVRGPIIQGRPIRVHPVDFGIWSYSCSDHPAEGIGLWHDQPSASDAAMTHVRTHHQEQT